MAFPTGWAHRVPITIESDDISSDLTNWTLAFDQAFDSVLTQVNGPLDADGTRASINGGGDVRFSSDESGTTQLPCDIRSWVTHNTPASATCEAAVRVSSVSSSGDTTVYMWWGKAAETQPAVGDTYGQYNAYDDNYVGVWDLGQDPSGGADAMLDRTSNQNHGTSAGTMLTEDLVTGALGGGIDFDGTDDRIECGDADEFSFTTGSPDGPFSIECLIDADTKTGDVFGVASKTRAAADGEYNWAYYINRMYFRVHDDSANSYLGAYSTDSGSGWEHISATYSGGGAWTDISLYNDGSGLTESASNTGSYTEMENTDREFMIGCRPIAWLAADYANLLNTAGFLTWGSISDISGDVVVTPNLGTLTITGYDPVVAVPVNVTPGLGTLEIASFNPVVTVPVNVTPGLGTLEATGYDPVVTVQVNVAAGLGTLEVTGFNPVVSASLNVTPELGLLSITGYNPSVAAFGGAGAIGIDRIAIRTVHMAH